MVDFEVANVVGWISYDQEFDLDALAETFSNHDAIAEVTYEPAENHWLQTHFAPDNTYVAFYRSGRCSVTGIKSLDQFWDVVDRVNSVMQDLIEFDYEPEAQVTNIVATTDLDTSLPLETIAIELGLDVVEYEPEEFPALIYREQDHVTLVFATGKLVVTGLTDLDEIDMALEELCQRIQELI